jgi:hypothetical protein
MSTITKLLPGKSTGYFAATQSVALNDYVVFNGVTDGNLADYRDYGIHRTISLTSTDNLSGVTFVIIGTSNGVTVTENVTGPNNTTVYSAKAYDTITTIQSTIAGSTNLSVGSGTTTVIPYVFGDRSHASFSSVQDSFGVNIVNPDTVTIDIYGSYKVLVAGEILAALSAGFNGCFSIHSGVATSYRMTSAETRGLQSLFFIVTSSGADLMYFDIFTA